MSSRQPARPARARSRAVAVPRGAAPASPRSRRRRLSLAPNRSSLLVGFAILAAAAGAYALARETSAFAVRRIDVAGASPPVAAQVRGALASFLDRSLVGLDGSALVRRLDALPTVVSADYDRAFPHTLRVSIVPERPVAVLRRGSESWLVSARARLMARVERGADADLPRIWVAARTPIGNAGDFLPPQAGAVQARALSVAHDFLPRIATASDASGTLVFQLRSGVSLRLGDPGDVLLKLAVARRALAQLPSGSTYLDVSVPGRPVAGSEAVDDDTNPQVSSGG